MLSGGCPHPPVAPVPARDGQRQRKEKQRQCDNHPDDLRTIRHGTAVGEIAEEHSVPEGKAKSEQAPIRRPPSRGGPLHRSAPSAFFSSTGRGAFSFCQEQKENGGRIPRGNGPLAGASLPGRLISASTPPPEAFPALKRETSPERSQSYPSCRIRSSSKAPAPII